MKLDALLLLSGGLDSYVLAHSYRKTHEPSKTAILFFNYGQRSVTRERAAVRRLGKSHGLRVVEQKIDLPGWRNHPLCNDRFSYVDRPTVVVSDVDNAPGVDWWVPYRNTVFTAAAAAWIFKNQGSHKLWHTEIVAGFQRSSHDGADQGTRSVDLNSRLLGQIPDGVAVNPKFRAPFASFSKHAMLLLGRDFGIDWTGFWSCENRYEKQCGVCRPCVALRDAAYELKIAAGELIPLPEFLSPQRIEKITGKSITYHAYRSWP